jgi:Kef-type K+ transport systems, membrane components
MYSKNKIFGIGAAALILMLVIPLILFAQPAAGEVAGSDFVSRMAVLVIQLSIIIVAAWAGGVVFERFRLPAVLGEIIAGTIIGPYLLGQLPIWGFNQGLFPLAGSFPISDELYAFTTIASIVLLFLAGVETDVKTFLRFSLAGGVIGLCGVVFSFLFGTLASVLFSSYVFGSHYGFTHPVSLFLGVISTATSVSITARILSEKKK